MINTDIPDTKFFKDFFFSKIPLPLPPPCPSPPDSTVSIAVNNNEIQHNNSTGS